MLQKDPAGRPSAKGVLTFLESLVDKSAAGMAVVKPQGSSLGAKTTIFSHESFKFTKTVSVQKQEESKALASTGAVAPKTEQTQSNENIKEYLRATQPLTVCSREVLSKC